MREGGEAALCVLASCEAPEREGDGLTSMGAGVVLSSARVGMEQLVFYTALGGGLARVDRLWRTFAGKEKASPAFDTVAAALAAK